MEGYTAWYKYQTEATIHLFRWNAEFTEKVWAALSSRLPPYGEDAGGKPCDPISAALLLRRQDATALADLAKLFNITEKQVWALLIDQAEPATTSLDRLSDARDQLHRLTAQEDYAQQQRLHANFNYGNAERERQSDRAKNPRSKIGEGDEETTMAGIIHDLATTAKYKDWPAKELWTAFLGVLDEYHLDPVEDNTVSGKIKCTYDFRGRRKSISFKHFSNVVSESR